MEEMMKLERKLVGFAVALSLVTATSGPVLASDDAAWKFHEDAIVDYEFLAPYAVLPIRDDVTIIDSRPARKYSEGHVPTSLTMPDLKFEGMAAGVLPEDKAELLVFYCGGFKCKLSHNSAYKAEAMGYTNVKVYAAGFPDWKAKGGVASIDTVRLQQMMAGEDPVMVVDSRPKGRKYDVGHVPGAISLPDSKFEKLAGVLPADKATALVFYCGGFKCKLSDNSARKAMANGYTNVMTYQAGFPAWKKEAGVVAMNVAPDTEAAGAAAPALPAAGEGVVKGEEFLAMIANPPADLLIVDVRDEEEYAAGHIPASLNMPVGKLEDQLFDLPEDKQIVFVCTTGGRSGEAYDLTKLLRPELNVKFVDAVIDYNKDGTVAVNPSN
jgi:rhodanese-related sulfurtransferase